MKNKDKIKIICALFLMLILIGNLQTSNANKISMAYLYGNYDYEKLILRSENSLNIVSPSSFDLSSTGNLIYNTIDKNFIEKMHQNQIKITPFLSNHWDKAKGQKALANRENLANAIVKIINEQNLDGINVDIENVTETDRENYVDLIRILKEKLPKEKIVSVAVAANPNGINKGWQGSYDYENLANYADYLMIMAYDEHYEGGEKGAVASINFVEASIKYALKKVDNEKIVIGIPFYGRYWKEGATNGGYGITLNKINMITNNYETALTYDKVNETQIATVKIKQSDRKPTVNGRTLYEGTYNFYYENEESIKKKIELVQKYNLKGIGAWSLGQETNEVWSYYATYLKRKNDDFVDIENVEWAKNSIQYIKEKGWIKGRENNIYAPKENLTRAEFATIICRILELDIINTRETLYVDTNNHWAKLSINALTKTGLIEGYDDNYFRPDKKITREEVCKVLSKIKEIKPKKLGKCGFDDVKETDWSYKYIINLLEAGVIEGYGDGTFRPQNTITRAEIAVMLTRMYK